jgi:hypothetical protein
MKARILGLVIAGAGCLAAVPAFASSMADGGPHAQYGSMGSHDSAGWRKDLWVNASSLDTRHEPKHFGDDPIWASPRPMPMPAAAPEIDRSSAAVALTLLLGGLAFWRARRRRA